MLTSADVVEKVIAGVLDGRISLSGSTVEQCLVLANSVGVSRFLNCLACTAMGILHV